ncbi:MAG: MGH1-like glycoside hydrolase domain-containing protein [Planctomycetota bacterium]
MAVSDIVDAVSPVGGMPYYEVSDAELGPGASFGNGHVWVNTGTDGRIHTFFSVDVGEEVAGPLIVRYGSSEARVSGAEAARLRRADVPLNPAGTGRFQIHPAYQKHIFDLPGHIEVEEIVSVPVAPEGQPGDESVAYYCVELRNRGRTERSLSVYAFARLGGTRRRPTMRGEYEEQLGALLAWEDGNRDWVRSLACSRAPCSHVITDDLGRLYDTDAIPALEGVTEAAGDVLGCLEVHVTIPPGESEQLDFMLAFTAEGRSEAADQVERLRSGRQVVRRGVQHLRDEVSACRVMTPDPVINQGAFWSKVNTLRVLAHYPEGVAFTNEPGVSSNVVARDVIWYVYGCDHFQPEVSRQLMNHLVRVQYENGMIPEYFNARTGETDDYELNINDGTPLFVLGMNHHVRSTGDFDYLREVYDSVAAASRYILSQRDDRGLVFCEGDGVEVWGIASWRNVIPNYRINGAVTEINAECAAALRAMGHMAENIGRDEDYDYFYGAAEDLTEAINEHLLDEERQLYLLNIDTEGRRHTDVTADQCFPVLFRVAPEEVAFRIIRRLNSPDFRTPAGLRTCSRLDPLYEPTDYVGLLGGVWPGLTFWYAFAAARYHPGFMVDALHASYAHYTEHPRVYNTVPGQFSEWFDGESLINRGMRLSPWEPPRFLWAAVEGVCGMMLSPEEPGIRPLIPPDWKWVALHDVCYHGAHLTAFAGREGRELHVYADTDFREAGSKDVLERNLTDRVRVGHSGIHPIALADDERTVVALGSCRQEAITSPVELGEVLEADANYELTQYSSERAEWTEPETLRGEQLASLGIRIEARGYHVLNLTRQGAL